MNHPRLTIACALLFFAAACATTYAAAAGLSFSNTGTSYNVDNARGAYWTLCIPATEDLPADTIVSISSISIGSRNSTFTSEGNNGDASSITVVDVNGTAVRSDVITAHDGTIAANASTSVGRLKYNFGSGVMVRVGTATAMTLCNSNGNALNQSAGGAKLVGTSDADSVLKMNTVTDGKHYPVYEIDAAIVSDAAVTTISSSTSASALTWDPEVASGTTQAAVVNVTADSTLTLDQTLSFAAVTFNVPAGVTLSLEGADRVSATSITINGGSVVAGPSLLAGALSGDGEAVYTNALPSGVTFSSGWTGTVALENISGITGDNCNFDDYGNQSSSVRLSGVSGWIAAHYTNKVEIVLDNDGYDYALKLTDAHSPQSSDHSGGANLNRCTVFNKISGSGKLTDTHATAWPVVKIYDASEFTGTLALKNAVVVFCTPDGDAALNGKTLYELFSATKGAVYVAEGTTVQIASGKSWSATCGLLGSGTAAWSGTVPTLYATNDLWTGTVSISNVATAKDGSLYPFNVNDYGNTNSTIALTSVGSSTNNTTYLPDTTIGRLLLTDSGDAPALRLSDGKSSTCTTIGELAGTGTFTNINAGIYQGLAINAITNFTGTLALGKMTVTFGTRRRAGQTSSLTSSEYKSKLYIDSDAKVSLPAGFALWSPADVVIDGPVNFTTGEAGYDSLTLFSNVGSTVTFSNGCAITVNGAAYNQAKYRLVVNNGNLILRKRMVGHMMILR